MKFKIIEKSRPSKGLPERSTETIVEAEDQETAELYAEQHRVHLDTELCVTPVKDKP